MIKAYQSGLLTNTYLQREARSLEESGYINKAQLRHIESLLPSYQGHSHWLIRTGFFLLGWLLFGASSFAISVFTGIFDGANYYYAFLLFAVLAFITLELILIGQLKYFCHGIDDAFLFSGILNLLLFFGFFAEAHADLRLFYLLVTVIGSLACLRYIDSFSAFVACAGPVALVADICIKTDTGRKILPFAMLALSLLIWFLQTRALRLSEGRSYYRKSLQVVSSFSAVLCYLSCNYLIVRELGEILMHTEVQAGADITFAPFFYLFTVFCPLVFLLIALKKRNRLLLWISFFAIGFSIFTIRHYYHVIPVETAMLVGGALLFVLAWYARKKLEGRTEGPSFMNSKAPASEEFLNMEALLIIGGSATAREMDSTEDVSGGGGAFGGGGSGDKY